MRRKLWRREQMGVDPHCRYCERPLSEGTATVDHRVPIHAGVFAEKDRRNWVLCCVPCNNLKGGDLADMNETWELAIPLHGEKLENVSHNLRKVGRKFRCKVTTPEDGILQAVGLRRDLSLLRQYVVRHRIAFIEVLYQPCPIVEFCRA